MRCYYIGAIIAGIGTAASLASMGYQASQGSPAYPNTQRGAEAVAGSQAAMLPYQRAIAALEQQGGTFQATPTQMSYADAKAKLGQLKQQWRASDKRDQSLVAQMDSISSVLKAAKHGDTVTLFQDKDGKFIPKQIAGADFKGYGTADIEGALAKKFSDIQLDLGKKYGVAFADQARKNAELADPMGTQARKNEYDLIQQEINNPKPINPLSTGLESQIDAQLKSGSGLDSMSQDLLDSAVARANADRAGGTSAGDVAGSMSTGAEGEARRQAGIAKAQGFLSSGSTPEDIQYRRNQQDLANLGDFVGGRTPESQFAALSGAGIGAAPFHPGQTLPGMPNNAAAVGSNAAVQGYNAQLNAQMNSASPWLAGLSTILQSAGTVANIAGKP